MFNLQLIRRGSVLIVANFCCSETNTILYTFHMGQNNETYPVYRWFVDLILSYQLIKFKRQWIFDRLM